MARAKAVKSGKAGKSVQAKPKANAKPAKGPSARVALLVATRKGAWVMTSSRARKSWDASGPHFLGNIIHHMMLDPRDGRTLLAAAKTGHLGPTIFRSTNFGKTWKEATRPPAFPKVPEGQKGRTVDHTFWLTPGHTSQPGVWLAGTSPHGLFRTEDGGVTWEPIKGMNDDPQYRTWMGGDQDGTPDGPKMHSVIVDPRDPDHLYVGMSSGGVHESTDGGASWKPLVKGMQVVDGFDINDISTHDPHCVRIAPSNPDRLYQQNHCGIYRLDRPGTEWERIGKSMPKAVGDIGFGIAVHPRNDKTAWVFPMDGQTVWPRTTIAGKPAIFVTRNAGKTWKRQDNGMPVGQAWWTVLRQALSVDGQDPAGVYFGTTSGELWMGRDEGEKWSLIARHLPEIYAVEAVEPA